MAHATWTCFAAVFQYLHRSSTEPFAQTLMTGLMESTRSATLGGARKPSLRLGLMRAKEWAEGIAELKRSALADGTFCYTFFQATARMA